MRKTRGVLAVAACLAVVPGPALADEFDASGSGSLGSADLTVDGQSSHSGALAPCGVGSVPSNSTGPLVVGPATRFGPGTTKCTLNPNHTAGVAVDGQGFETRLLARYGGPVIRIRSFKAACDTVDNGSRSRIEFTGVSGVNVPSNIPANYTVTIPGAAGDSRPMAVVVLNEVSARQPSDGGLGVNALHLKLFPQGGPAHGDIEAGSVYCAP